MFDTLNAKAALEACEEAFEATGRRVPIMLSGTITDASGRTLSGQTPEAFVVSTEHADLFSVGLNCALGPEPMHPYLREIAETTGALVSTHPNAGLPNAFGEYDETPEQMAAGARRLRPRGPAQRGRRLLRHHPGAHRRVRRGRGGRRRRGPPTPPRTGCAPPAWKSST